MKVLRILLIAVASFAALILVAAVLLAAFFDPNDYKGYVTSWVEERTGRPFAIDGDLELAFFPWLAIETDDVKLGNPPGFASSEPFARVERLAAGVRLMPLLERRLEIGSVRLEGVRLDLERGADGRGNWETFGGAPAEDGGGDSEAAGGFVENLDIESVAVRRSEVRWHEGGRLRYVLDDIRIETGRIRAGDPIDVSLAASVLDVDSERTFDVEAESRVALSVLGALDDDAAVALDAFALSLGVRDESLDEIASGRLDAARFRAWQDGRVEIGDARVDGRVAPAPAVPNGLTFGASWSAARFDPASGDLALADLVTRVADVEASWQLDARNVIDAPRVTGSMATAAAPIGGALAAFGVSLPEGIEAAALGTLDASAQFRAALSLDAGAQADAGALGLGPYRVDALDVDTLELAMLGVRASGGAALDGSVLNADIDVPAFEPTDALRTIVAPHVPAGIDLTVVDRIGLAGRAEIDTSTASVSIRDLRAELLGAELVAAVDGAPGAPAARIAGTFRAPGIAPERLARLLGDAWPAELAPAELGTLGIETRFEYDGRAGRLSLDDLALQAFGLAADGRVTVAGLAETPSASGELSIGEFSPRDVLRRFGRPVPSTSDPAALGRARLAARFDASSQSVRVEKAALVLDDSRITGDFAVTGLDAATPTYRFDLAIDRVDADRYLPPRQSEVPDDAAETQTAGDIELPAEALRSLRIEGQVTVGALRLAGLDFADVATGIAVGGGRASLSPARARLYGGTFDGSFEVDTTSEPGLELTGRAESLRLEPLITALTGDANFSGIGDFDLDLAGRGATVIENVETASGSVTFTMRDGAIEGFNLGRGLCVVYNATQRLAAPAEQPDRTEYGLIRGTAGVRDGVASSSDLLARSSFMDLTGRGTLALAAQRLDYALEATLTGSTGIPGCEAMDDLVGESLPLTLRGTVTDPEIRPDFSEIIERRVRDAVRDRLQDRLEDRLRDLLR